MIQLRRLATILVLAGAGLAGACQVLVGVEDEVGSPRTPDAAADAQDASEAGPTTCFLAHPPAPPAAASGTSIPALVFAFSKLLVRPIGAAPIGYDLDGLCTAADSGPADRPCTGPLAVDGPGGLDNSFGLVISDELSIVPGDGGADPAGNAVNQQTARGEHTIMLFLNSYNGLPDDDDVSVGLIATGALISSDCAANPQALDAKAADAGRPALNGCDVWSSLPDGTVSSSPPFPIVHQKGYVRGGTLVVGPASFTFAIGNIEFRLKGAYLTAKITATPGDAGSHVLTDGIIAGRTPVEQMIIAATRFSLSGDPKAPKICQDRGLVEIATMGLCAARDLRATGGNDSTAVCDAVSMAFGFEAVIARLGNEGNALPDAGCPPIDPSCLNQ